MRYLVLTVTTGVGDAITDPILKGDRLCQQHAANHVDAGMGPTSALFRVPGPQRLPSLSLGSFSVLVLCSRTFHRNILVCTVGSGGHWSMRLLWRWLVARGLPFQLDLILKLNFGFKVRKLGVAGSFHMGQSVDVATPKHKVSC